jgi:hypothetical protein
MHQFRIVKGTERWARAQVFLKAYARDKGNNRRTCGFVREVPTGNQGAALAHQRKNDPMTRRLTDPAKLGGLHQVVSEPLSVCRLQAKGGRVYKENTLLHTIK